MPNHFHFLVRFKDKKTIQQLENFKQNENINFFLSKQFANFFSSYTQAFNKQQGRMGSLFMRSFKRKKIKDENYLRNLIKYIHLNPVDARICKTPKDWKYSSFNTLVSEYPSFLVRDEVLNYFDDLENFLNVHS
jgi:REP element-mobilizing transposase RayT